MNLLVWALVWWWRRPQPADDSTKLQAEIDCRYYQRRVNGDTAVCLPNRPMHFARPLIMRDGMTIIGPHAPGIGRLNGLVGGR